MYASEYMTKQQVGIIGLGSFGKFLASLLIEDDRFDVCGFEKQKLFDSPVPLKPLDVVAGSDIVVLAVPYTSYAEILPNIATSLRYDALLVDICSVKTLPAEAIDTHLPGHGNLLLTHPLFGPNTAGRRLAVTDVRGSVAQQFLSVLEDTFGMQVVQMTNEEHDQAMAQIHVLSLFVARGLSNLGLKDHALATPTYELIMQLVRLDRSHSEALFQTVQSANPYAEQIRQDIVQSFTNLELELRKKNT